MRVLNNVTLTDYQKQVLAKVVASPTPKVAGAQISAGQNMVAARDQLLKLGALTFSLGEVKLTEKGQQLAQSENITDQSGQLTDEGQQLAQADPGKDPSQTPASPQGQQDPLGGDQMGMDEPLPKDDGIDAPLPLKASYEPFEFMRELIQLSESK